MKKSAIVYYSLSGNTEKVAGILRKELEPEFQSDVIRLEALDESPKFLGQAARAFMKKEAKLKEPVNFDLSGYDLVALGTPVWAFGMAPALRAYLSKCKGMEGKKILVFSTYGSGVGKDKCVQEIADIAKSRAASKISSFLIQQGDVRKEEKVKQEIKKALVDNG